MTSSRNVTSPGSATLRARGNGAASGAPSGPLGYSVRFDINNDPRELTLETYRQTPRCRRLEPALHELAELAGGCAAHEAGRAGLAHDARPPTLQRKAELTYRSDAQKVLERLQKREPGHERPCPAKPLACQHDAVAVGQIDVEARSRGLVAGGRPRRRS